ncbi:MAG: hypothetical protein IKS59_02680 [Aeriscardovia sp.]|jgi:hypothetical protein|nr:hypothetical protein [Aeriscardovia sp.]
MEELNYIIKQAKRFHYTNWDDSELKKCIGMLQDLNRSELVSLYTSRWISYNKTLKEEVFKLLFSDKIGKLNDKIKEMDTEKLIEELLNKKGGMVSLARQELRRRYIENDQEDKTKIALAFAQSSVRDNNWLESQMRKELYGIG